MTRKPRVLIVDDRIGVRLTIRNILRRFDCDFSEAESGDAALDLLSTCEFEVIFLDLMLPDLSGIEILRRARELSISLGKVIILTGLPQLKTQAEATELGVFGYFAKDPIDPEQIRSAFTEAISNLPFRFPSPPENSGVPKAGRDRPTSRVLDAKDAKAASASRPRLLVLDDNPRWLATIQRVLESNFDLTLTTSADEACKRAKKENFALVLLDMKLPGGTSGLDVLSRMRRAGPNLRAIILTEHPDYDTAVESIKRGALHYVSKDKPFTLSERVQRILSENARPIRVFLSYEKTDRTRVLRLYERLMRSGFLPWMDVKSIVGGKKWEPELQAAIEECDFFVFCLSRHSLHKEGWMRREVEQALERQKGFRDDSVFFIPARLEHCEDVEPFRKFFYVDLFKKDGFEKLLRALTSSTHPAQ